MNYRGLESKLRKIVEKRMEEGWLLEPFATCNALLVGVGQCCPLMAAVIEDRDEVINTNFVAVGAEILGITYDQAKSIECGFEDWKGYDDERCFQIGAKLRRDYCETA